MNRRVLIGVGAVVVLGVAGVVTWLTRPPPDKPPNVLLIVWDTVRADRMSLYGHKKPTTPNLEAFSTGALVYERAISPGMWTIPSHASLFTGLPVTTHGAHHDYQWLDDHHVTLAEHLRSNGYDTYAFTANPQLSKERVNLLQGFDVTEHSWDATWRDRVVSDTNAKLLPKDRSTEISPANKKAKVGEWASKLFDAGPATHDALTGWLDRRESDKPWFAFLNYMEAHHPRVPSAAGRKQVTRNNDVIGVGLDTQLTRERQRHLSFGLDSLEDAEVYAANAVYDACIADLDAATGDLLLDLRDRGVLRDTIVILTSDHGENIGDHGLWDHRYVLYDSLVHVPLVVFFPSKVPAGRIKAPVSTTDIFATITELAGLPAAPTATGSTSLFAPAGQAAVFTEMVAVPPVPERFTDQLDDVDRWSRTARAIVQPGAKLHAWSDGTVELYNLKDDPGETKNIVDGSPKRRRGMKRHLDRWTSEQTPYDPARRGPSDAGASDPAAADVHQMLKGLGYTEDE